MNSESDRPFASARNRTTGKSKLKKTSKEIKDHTISSNAEGRSTAARLQALLENLDIRFVDCTLTYRQEHLDIAKNKIPIKKPSKFQKLRNVIRNTIEVVRDAVELEKTFTDCLFFPLDEEDKVKDFIQSNFSEAKLSFVNCKFIKRNSSVFEKVTRGLRKVFGIQFELEYINSSATINHYTFRLKDILLVYNHIQERIIEEA